MANNKKGKEDTQRITVRLEFEGPMHDLLQDFRFDGRFDNYKAATLKLIENGLMSWKASKETTNNTIHDNPKEIPPDKPKFK